MPSPSPPPTREYSTGQEDDELEDDDYESDFDPETFKIRDPLSPPNAIRYTTQQLNDLIHDDGIDLNPPWQRDVVWSEAKQVHLIESIYRNYYVPPVVFAMSLNEFGDPVRVCVDGKQRLTSIANFFVGKIPYRDPMTKKKWYYTIPRSSKGSKLAIPLEWKQQFASKLITCVEYESLRPGAERDIFQRVQLGVSLTTAEKIQAILSPRAEWISELVQKHISVEGGLSQHLDWDTKRGRDFQCLAQMICCCEQIDEEPIPVAALLENWISDTDGPEADFQHDIDEVLRELWKIVCTKKYSDAFTKIQKRVAPAEFVYIGVLLYALRDTDTATRAKAVYNLRLSIRESFKDIRMNSNVGKVIWAFVNTIRDDPTDTPEYITKGGKKPKSSPKKRVREAESDTDYRPAKRGPGRPRKSG